MNEFEDILVRLDARVHATVVKFGLRYGIDDDDESQHQYSHVCWPERLVGGGALCGTKRLWGAGFEKPIKRVDCLECLKRLRHLEAVSTEAVSAMAKTPRTAGTLPAAARAYRRGLERAIEEIRERSNALYCSEGDIDAVAAIQDVIDSLTDNEQ